MGQIKLHADMLEDPAGEVEAPGHALQRSKYIPNFGSKTSFRYVLTGHLHAVMTPPGETVSPGQGLQKEPSR